MFFTNYLIMKKLCYILTNQPILSKTSGLIVKLILTVHCTVNFKLNKLYSFKEWNGRFSSPSLNLYTCGGKYNIEYTIHNSTYGASTGGNLPKNHK